MMRKNFQTTAPAKINLSLSVGPPIESKGMMHPIASWMTTLDFFDEVCVTRLDEGDLSRYAVLWHEDAPQKTTIDWPITSDLAVRAHRRLEAEVGRSLPIQLKVEKRIPVGGGLGGGSSDAAATLRALKELFQLDIDIHAIGASLGSDIPFLIDGGSQIVTGFGEQLESFSKVQRAVVLILPPYGCPTGEVYDAFDELCRPTLDEEQVRDGVIFNALTTAAMEISEELSSDMAKIEAVAEVEVHLSGSGSSMFVICDNVMHAEALTLVIKEKTGLVAIAANTIIPEF
jgi:4-diphosphocytidyl-2-C-methyl-D-erythritol kinase